MGKVLGQFPGPMNVVTGFPGILSTVSVSDRIGRLIQIKSLRDARKEDDSEPEDSVVRVPTRIIVP